MQPVPDRSQPLFSMNHSLDSPTSSSQNRAETTMPSIPKPNTRQAPPPVPALSTTVFQPGLFEGKVLFCTGGGSGICKEITQNMVCMLPFAISDAFRTAGHSNSCHPPKRSARIPLLTFYVLCVLANKCIDATGRQGHHCGTKQRTPQVGGEGTFRRDRPRMSTSRSGCA